MFYLLDTNICIFLIANKAPVLNRIAEVGIANCFIAEATIAELYYGVYRSSKMAENYRSVTNLISNFNIIETRFVLETFGETKARLASEGRIIADFDLLIGCTALFFDMPCVTNNTKHLNHIPNLKLEDWTKE